MWSDLGPRGLESGFWKVRRGGLQAELGTGELEALVLFFFFFKCGKDSPNTNTNADVKVHKQLDKSIVTGIRTSS